MKIMDQTFLLVKVSQSVFLANNNTTYVDTPNNLFKNVQVDSVIFLKITTKNN